MRYRKLFIILAVLILGGLLAIQVNAGPKGKGKGPKASAPVPQTGQTTPDSDYDDGYYQTGVDWPDPRFTNNGDGTVKDNLTGLIWLEDANSFGLKTWAVALTDCYNLTDGSYGLTDNSSAGDWRLPNINELQSLIHYGVWDPALPNTDGTGQWTEADPFTNVQSTGDYWSSTTYPSITSTACHVYLYNGFVANDNKSWTNYVWCVRGGN